jgi:hypothetical protein
MLSGIVFGFFPASFGLGSGVVDESAGEWGFGVDGVPAGPFGFGVADFAGVSHRPLKSGIVRVGEETEGRRFAV